MKYLAFKKKKLSKKAEINSQIDLNVIHQRNKS